MGGVEGGGIQINSQFQPGPMITPRACARGKVIGRIVVVVISRKSAISRGLGTGATSNHNESVQFGKKTGFNVLRIEGYGPRASQMVPFC